MSPIGLKSLSPRALAAVFICWLLLILVLVFGFIPLTCAETLPRGGRLSLMDASPLGNGLGIWADRIQQNHNEVMNHLIRLSKGN